MADNPVVTLRDENGNPVGTAGNPLTASVPDPAPQTILNQPSAAQTTSGNSGTLATTAVATLAVDVNVTAVSGTTPTLNLFLDRLGADGVWYPAWTSAQVTAAGTTSTSVGPGAATAAVLTGSTRLRWVIGGTTPSFTFSASVVGR